MLSARWELMIHTIIELDRLYILSYIGTKNAICDRVRDIDFNGL